MAASATTHATLTFQRALKDVVTGGRRILIVGCPPGTFTYWMTKHPALMFWPSSEAKVSDDRRIVPAEVGAVIQTKMLSHALSANVRQQARERGLVCPADTFSPGAVMRLLDGVVEPPAKKGDDDVANRMPSTDLRAVDQPLDQETKELIESIDDAIAGLELVKEKVVHLGRQYNVVREKLVVLDTLKQFLNK